MAILLATLMLALPWAATPPSDLEPEKNSDTTSRTWGAGGSNDTGWITLEATGADPENGTMAYADLFLDFAWYCSPVSHCFAFIGVFSAISA